jgi:hypothetical protein
MLPSDTKARREAGRGLKQGLISDAFAGAAKAQRFSQALFQEAALEWLIDTDQVSG